MPSADIERDNLIVAVGQIADALGDVDGLRAAQEAGFRDQQAKLNLLMEDRRVTKTQGDPDNIPDGLLRYHLSTPIFDDAKQKIEAITFRKPTVGTIRAASRYVSEEEWTAFVIKTLSYEIADDNTLNRIDAAEWDAIVEVAKFPFVCAPSRIGEARTTDPTSSGGTS